MQESLILKSKRTYNAKAIEVAIPKNKAEVVWVCRYKALDGSLHYTEGGTLGASEAYLLDLEREKDKEQVEQLD